MAIQPNDLARKVILIGTDHRLQMTVAQDKTTKQLVPRTGGRFRKLITFCIEKLGAETILEETHERQEQTASTICSVIAKEHGMTWQPLALGEPSLTDGLFDPPVNQAFQTGIKPDLLAGRYVLNTHKQREAYMHTIISQCLQRYRCVLVVVGYSHLAVLANRFDDERVEVEALMFTYPLVVDESMA